MSKLHNILLAIGVAISLGVLLPSCSIPNGNKNTPSLISSFTYSPASPGAGQAVQFTDTSTGSPTSWQWNFGDGSTSTTQNPSHVFAAAGSYSVTLMVTNSTGSKSASHTITVAVALSASFTYSPASPVAGQAVQFTDTSTGGPTSWQWNFGDGTTSTAQSPSHTFQAVASYNVTLTVTNTSGSKSIGQTVNVLPAAALIASFTFSPSSPTSGQSVQFTDTSTGTPTSWQWDFGDGGSSTIENPNHAYTTSGTCTVTLNVGNGSGTSNATRTITVSSGSPTYELPADRMINWTAAGVPGGIKTRTTTHAVTGLHGDDTNDDRATIQAAINSCPAGEVVLLPAGTFRLSSALTITTPITLRGQGPTTTILKGYSTGNPSVIRLGSDSAYSFSATGVSIISGYTKGSTSIVVSSASGFTNGHLMLIDQLNDGTLVTDVGSGGSATWVDRANGTRALRQLVKITGISGTTVNFSPALFYTFTAGLSPQASCISTSIPALAADGGSIGVENLTIQDAAGNSGSPRWSVSAKVITNSWLYKVYLKNSFSGHIITMHTLQSTFKMCYVDGAYQISPSHGYGFEIGDGTCSCLLEDNIVYKTSAEYMIENGAAGNVIAYNYGETVGLDSNPTAELPVLQPAHGAHPYYNLFEGNNVTNFTADNFWGTSSHNTVFRNFIPAYYPSMTSEVFAIYIDTQQNYYSVIGNVLGTAGKGFVYEKIYPTSASSSDFLIYLLGYSEGSGGGTDTATTILRHANYDVVNNGVIYNGSDIHALPNSLYLASKPSWFGSLAWPAIGPDISGYVTDIPAKWRWDQFKTSGLLSDLFKDHQ